MIDYNMAVLEPKKYLNSTDFAGGESVGGVTGSKRVKHQEQNLFYQLKPSILSAKAMIRRIKAKGLDQENFGEFIAASVGRAVTNSDQGPELVPKVELIYDNKNKQCLVASKYLQNVEGNLNQYGEKKGFKGKEEFINIASGYGSSKEGELNIAPSKDQGKALKQDLATAIAVSALTGDHDINPGNMMVANVNGVARIARIDFGHAFDDLLRAPKIFGGGRDNPKNNILDFFNRDTVSHLNPNQQISKLWQSYSGIVPSREMVKALENLGGSSNMTQGLDQAKNTFSDLIKDLDSIKKGESDYKDNQQVIYHIKKSLNNINDNISKTKVDIRDPKFVDKVFDNLGQYCKQNQQQMLDVSKLMSLQLKIDEMLIGIKMNEQPSAKQLMEIQDKYKEISQISSLNGGKNKICWIKEDKNKPAFKGDLDGYLKYKSKELNIALNLGKTPSVIKSDNHPATNNSFSVSSMFYKAIIRRDSNPNINKEKTHIESLKKSTNNSHRQDKNSGRGR